MTGHDLPILGLLQLLPAAGAMALYRVRSSTLVLTFGALLGLVEFGLSLYLYSIFNANSSAMQLSEQLHLIGPLRYTVAADGLTVLFMLLTAFLTLLVLAYGGLVRRFAPLARFFATVFACQSALMGQFATVDLLWFTLMTLAHTVLIGIMLNTWAVSSDEGPAVNRYYQFMGLSLLLLLVATMIFGWSHADTTNGLWRFDLPSLIKDQRSPYLQSVLFFLLFYGLAIRIPLFPLHGWLPIVMERGTVASAMVLLLGLKTGIYGMLRFLFPLVPKAVLEWHEYVVAIAIMGIFYAALLAVLQLNLRKLFAYAVISHTSVLILGLFSLSPHAFQGGAIMASTFGLAISTLLLMAGVIFLRTNTLLMSRLGGFFDHLPLMGVAFLVAALSVAGMPGTPGFEAVHLIMESSIDRFGALVTVTAAMGNVAAASCLLWAFQRTFLATPATPDGTKKTVRRATPTETSIAALLLAVQLIAGFYTEPWLHLVKKATDKLALPYSELRP